MEQMNHLDVVHFTQNILCHISLQNVPRSNTRIRLDDRNTPQSFKNRC